LDAAQQGGYHMSPQYTAFCGDDEDVHHQSFAEAVVHVSVYQMTGHAINSTKQLGGVSHHEFLRMVGDPVNMPERPLASILSTIATGNWYVEQSLWYDSVIASVSANFWDAVCRGMPLRAGQQLAGMYLDILMRYKSQEGTWHKLEWWSYRKKVGGPFLWQGVDGGEEEPISINSKITPDNTWPSKATDAWMEKQLRYVKDLPNKKKKEYKQRLLSATYGGTFHSYRMKDILKQTQDYWPERHSRVRVVQEDVQPLRATRHEWDLELTNMQVEDDPQTLDELLARLGLDIELTKIVGTQKVLEGYIAPEYWCRHTALRPAKKLTLQAACANAAFRYVIMHKIGASATWILKEERVRRGISYILGRNGAGKTWLTSRNPVIADFDSLIRQTTGFDRYIVDPLKDGNNRSIRTVMEAIWNGMNQNKFIFTGQWPWILVSKAAEKLKLEIKFFILDPGDDITYNRLVERGWDEETIERYFVRWKLASHGCPGISVSNARELLYLR